MTFETRNLGVTFEVDPAVSNDGHTVNLTLIPQHVKLLGTRKLEVQDPAGKKFTVEQPEIATYRLTTSLQVRDGEHTLLGSFKVGETDQVELFILHTQLSHLEVPL